MLKTLDIKSCVAFAPSFLVVFWQNIYSCTLTISNNREKKRLGTYIALFFFSHRPKSLVIYKAEHGSTSIKFAVVK